MYLTEKLIHIPAPKGNISLLEHFKQATYSQLSSNEIPVRFVITKSNSNTFLCELGVLSGVEKSLHTSQQVSIFEFERRKVENTNTFNSVLLVPTGIGAEIGGHAGDAGPVARLLASVCDTLITHPNVVNASDINELPENGLYVEGSIVSKLFMGTIGLQKIKANRVILVIDKFEDKVIYEDIINSVSAARATLGLNCPFVVKMKSPIEMRTEYSPSGRATGRIEGLEELFEVVSNHRSKFDAVAISSLIDVQDEIVDEYFQCSGNIVNPWGGVEAMLTHAVSILFGIPSAHAPMMRDTETMVKHFGIVDPRMSAETVSICFLHSVLKGLHRSPRIIRNPLNFGYSGVLSAADISCLVVPDGCIGLPTLAALEQGIPVIAVRENRNCMKNDLKTLPFEPNKLFIVDNYFEAVGIMAALKAGVATSSVRRPLEYTNVIPDGDTNNEKGAIKATKSTQRIDTNR